MVLRRWRRALFREAIRAGKLLGVPLHLPEACSNGEAVKTSNGSPHGGPVSLEAEITRHRRVGSAIDVALCGARDCLFSPSSRLLNCPVCRSKLEALQGANQYAGQMAAKRAQLRRLPSDFKGWPR